MSPNTKETKIAALEHKKQQLTRDYEAQCAQIDQELEALRAQAVCCKDCKHLYFKDMYAFCPCKEGPRSPNGSCSHGERRGNV